MSNDKIELIANGISYTGWKEVSITRSLRSISGTFDMTITDSWDVQDENWFLGPGTPIVIKYNGETMITGFVDKLQTSVSGSSRSISVSGRDKTGDLVDCSVESKNGRWIQYDLFRLAKALCAPFGITVIKNTDVGKVYPVWALQPGETVFQTLDRFARLRGIILTTDGLGNLVLTSPGVGTALIDLVQGVNIKSADLDFESSARFRKYIVKSQIAGTDDTNAYESAALFATATDKGARAGRTLIIIAEDRATPADAKKRVQWEAAFRAANASKINVEVVSWTQGENGPLWQPNQFVFLDAPFLGLKRQLLISDVVYSLSDSGGQTTKLTLQRKDALVVQPEVDVPFDPAFETGSDVE